MKLSRPTSYHFPLSLNMGWQKWGPTPFRFENMWLDHPDFLLNVEKWWWKDMRVSGWPEFKFMGKLKILKSHLKRWNKESFGFIEDEKRKIQKEIDDIDSGEEEGVLSKDLINRCNELKGNLAELVRKEQRMWNKKCKFQWLKEGDENTSFFHRWANSRRNRAFISSIEDDNGNFWTNMNDIEGEFLSYFKKLYSKDGNQKFVFEGVSWEPLSNILRTELKNPFSEEEVYRAVESLGNIKSSGPNGMTNEFFFKKLEHLEG